MQYSTGNSAQCHMAAWMGEEFEEEWIHVYVRLSPFAVYLKLSQLVGEGNDNPLQHSCLENSMDGGTW